MNIIPKPMLNDLPNHQLGEIKWIDYVRNFGFIISSDGKELFTHRGWLKEARFVVVGEQHNVVLDQTDKIFHSEQKVLYRPSKSQRGIEAEDVVDALDAYQCIKDAKASYIVALALWETLVSYRVTLIRDILVPRADNTTKQFIFHKTGETKVVIFQGNNAIALRDTLLSPHVTGTVKQPNTRLKYEMLSIDGSWVECGDPL